jgi:hypothetical protein
MLAWLSILACALYLAPLGALVMVLRREQDDALDLACAIGGLFAADLVGTFAITYLFRVEQAIFVRTGLLIGIAAVLAARRALRGEEIIRGRGALARADLGALALAAIAGFCVSHIVSSEYWIWDREWHVQFASSLRVQRMPFHNVFEPGKNLRYHLVGDLAAACLQSLSFAAMNASRALSLAHDLQSLLLVGITALFLRAACSWPPVTTALAALVPPLAGPIMVRVVGQVPGLGPFEANSDFNNLTLSFRPHCMIALLVLGALLAQVMRLARDEQRGRSPGGLAVAGLVPLFALLSISDEISTMLVGLSLGVLWVLWPRLLGSSRVRGAVMLAGLAAAALLANLALAGTIAPGGPIEHAHWLAPRIPRFGGPPHPLGLELEGWKQLFIDEGSLVLPGLVLAALLARDRAEALKDAFSPLAVLALGVTAGGLLFFLCFEVNGRTFEGHRFMTAARGLVPMVALIYAPRLARFSFGSLMLMLPVLAGVVITIGFIFYRLPVKPGTRGGELQYDTSCREEMGARFGEPMLPTYVDQPIWHLYAGCRPIFAAGHDGSPGVVLAGWPMLGPPGFAKMDRGFFPPGQPARVICARDPARTSPLCKKAQALAPCEPEGSLVLACRVPPAARPALGRP